MRQTTLRLPDLMLLVGTRVALGVGIGLLVAARLDERTRRGAGLALFAVGVLTTVPLLLNVRAGVEGPLERESAAGVRGGARPRSEGGGVGAFRDAPMPP